jgi:hypothetical protein
MANRHIRDEKKDGIKKGYHPKRVEKPEEGRAVRVGSINDGKWYIPTDQTAKDIGSFSFNKPIGQKGVIRYGVSNVHGNQSGEVNTPGLAVIRLAHAIGVAHDDHDAVNVLAKNIYSYIRHANSGHSNYDAPDLIMYLMGSADAYSGYAWMCRLYGTLNLYNSKNRYLPKGLIRAMNVDFDDMIAHLNDLRTYINVVALRLSSLYIPDTMPYFTRRFWLYSNVYADSSDPKAQLYMFNPAYFWRFDATAESTGSSLQPVFVDNTTATYNGAPAVTAITYSDLISIMNSLLDPLIGDEDIGIMAGDILKAYGPSHMLKVSQIPENYVVLPTYNEEVLSQIHNARFADHFWDLSSCRVVQNAAKTITEEKWIDCGASNFSLGTLSKKFSHDMYLNMHTADVTPEQVLVSTRLQWDCSGEAIAQTYQTVSHEICRITTCGTEVPLTIAVYEFGIGTVPNYTPADLQREQIVCDSLALQLTSPVTGTVSGSLSNVWSLACVSQFDWFPLIYALRVVDTGSSGTDNVDYMYVIGDVDNYRIMTYEDIKNLHTGALFGMFAIPQKI